MNIGENSLYWFRKQLIQKENTVQSFILKYMCGNIHKLHFVLHFLPIKTWRLKNAFVVILQWCFEWVYHKCEIIINIYFYFLKTEDFKIFDLWWSKSTWMFGLTLSSKTIFFFIFSETGMINFGSPWLTRFYFFTRFYIMKQLTNKV